MAKKNITIDQLAVMVKKGFDKTATIEVMEKGFDKVDKRFEQMDKKFERMDKRFDKIEKTKKWMNFLQKPI